MPTATNATLSQVYLASCIYNCVCINASNAAILALNAFALLRQHLPKEVNLNAFISHGGEATNIIPDRTVVQVELRA